MLSEAHMAEGNVAKLEFTNVFDSIEGRNPT